MSISLDTSRMPTYFLTHGGGPWPYMKGPIRLQFKLLEQSLQDIPRQLPRRPEAVLVISAHWEEVEFTVSTSPRPGMVFDYYDFPDYLYHISYPAPGSPELAERVRGLLSAASWPVREDPQRGYDHGTFSTLQPMYPQADMPIVQLSLKRTLDPEEHLAVGRALAPLRDEGVLIIGSGFSYHNLRALGPEGTAPSMAFDGWLRKTLIKSAPEARRDAIVQWERAPAARAAHPREEHLIPLMVAIGAAGDDPATCIYGDHFMGHIAASSFRFSADGRPAPGQFDQLSAGQAELP